MNLAGVWKLPLIFVCENNRYAETTAADFAVSGSDIAGRARGFGMPSVAVDGQNVFAMYEAARAAVEHARCHKGPTFIEAQTYRYFNHLEGDSGLCRTKEEVEFYRSRDCIQRFRNTVLDEELLDEDELNLIDRQVKNAMEEALRFAEESPQPVPQDTLSDVYVDFPETEIWPFQTAPVQPRR
jgi:pyruvate dehydrogenase E1 component alpha subunit